MSNVTVTSTNESDTSVSFSRHLAQYNSNITTGTAFDYIDALQGMLMGNPTYHNFSCSMTSIAVANLKAQRPVKQLGNVLMKVSQAPRFKTTRPVKSVSNPRLSSAQCLTIMFFMLELPLIFANMSHIVYFLGN